MPSYVSPKASGVRIQTMLAVALALVNMTAAPVRAIPASDTQPQTAPGLDRTALVRTLAGRIADQGRCILLIDGLPLGVA
ncbi:MAG: hypothetical protein V4671_11115 [Armatimonadota bacterium]